MQLQLQSFNTLVSNAAAAVQGSARQLLDLTVGSTLRAVLEANAAIALWMQWLILQVLATTRAATSNDADLDSWTADFSLTRLPASSATGQATFSRFTPSQAALIPAGISVRTSDGSQSFIVNADPTNPDWNAALASYTLGAGVASAILPITASGSGTAGNVQPGSITLLATAIPGVDSVTNGTSLSGGQGAESDTALRNRFSSYLASRARATPLAIGFAILSVRQGLRYTLQENIAPDGSVRIGSFVVTIDDGSGAPSASLLTSVASAIEQMRPVGSLYSVQPPSLVAANVSMAITTANAAFHNATAASVVQSIAAAINQLAIGAALPVTRLAQIAYATDPNVINVTAVLLNGGTADLIPASSGLIKAGLVQVN